MISGSERTRAGRGRGPHLARAALLAMAALASSKQAYAATCCGEASVGDRLMPDEDAAISFRPSVRTRVGSYADDGTFIPIDGATDLTFELAASVTARITEALEMGAVVPGIVNHRAANGVESETSGGVGDVRTHARLTVVPVTAHRYLPGVAVGVRTLIPTGVAPARAEKPLLSDATGQGAGEITLSATVEKTYEDVVLARVDGSAGFFLPETIDAQSSYRGPRLAVEAMLGPVLPPVALLVGLAYEREATGPGRSHTDVLLAGALDINRRISIVANLRFAIPASQLGQNDLVNVAAGAGLRVGFAGGR